MNVIPLLASKRGAGVTTSDQQSALRFVFARPGWNVVDRVYPQVGRCLEISFHRVNSVQVLTCRLTRLNSNIFVESIDNKINAGPYSNIHKALLEIWECSERYADGPQEKLNVLLCGLDPLLTESIQDIAELAGFEALMIAESGMELAIYANVHFAAAVVELQLYPSGGDLRNIIKLLRQLCPTLPVLALTTHPHTAPEADLHGLGGPTHRERRPHDADRVLQWLRQVHEAQGNGST